MPRKIQLITTNDFKYLEFKEIFNKYGIVVEKKSIAEFGDKPLAVMSEKIKMKDYYTDKVVVDYIDCLRVNIESILDVWWTDDYVKYKRYTNIVEGYLDLSKKTNNKDVFGWDDIFIVKDTYHTYYEKKAKGCKVSARDQNISQYLIDHIYYKERKKFKYTDTYDQQRTINFETADCVEFYNKNIQLLENERSVMIGLDNLFKKICNSGIFFRSAQNRRENIYWCPGLNAGIPHIQKKDKIHELTFTVHDFFHFLIPDLIFDGCCSNLSKKVYIISRMLSEAVTIVFADMIFVDTLQDIVDYDWTKRKIWPLFSEYTNTDGISDIDSKGIYNLVFANVCYCLLGDDRKYKEKVNNCNVLDDFKNKYMPFFVEDYKWTESNWNNMVSKKEHFVNWWGNVKHMRDHAIKKDSFGKLETVSEYIEKNNILDSMDVKELIYTMYDNLMKTDILPKLENSTEFNNFLEISNNAFSRWLIGQMYIFSKFSFLHESYIYSNKIKNTYLNKDYLSINEINAIRSLYEQYLNILYTKNLISKDDEIVYTETFPIFDPAFASYDKGIDAYENLKDVWKNILKK